MNLIIDIGNSRTKTAILSGGEIVERWTFDDFGVGMLKPILEKYPHIRRSILSSTRAEETPAEVHLRGMVPYFLRFGYGVPTPIKNLYRTPQTLGPDRLAAAVGANMLYPGDNLMVADLGTAITIDFVTATGEYLGGSISPGARMRFRALHDHTAKLPLGSLNDMTGDIAGTTSEAVANGVGHGIVYEIEGYRREWSARMPGLRLILTGGDADFFEKQLKNTIFANYDLVIAGLNRILDYNADQTQTF